MLRKTIKDAIKESWSGSAIPYPYGVGNEYSRGQFEMAILLLGQGEYEFMSDAVEDLWAEIVAER